jgi:predicted membrane protein
MRKNNKLNNVNINYFEIKLSTEQIRFMLIIIVLLIIILLFRKQFTLILEKIIIFMILFLLVLIISKNLIVSIFVSCIIFLLLNLIVNYKNDIENFENEEKKINIEEPVFDKNIFEKDDYKKSASGIQDLLKKVNGGIPLKDDDLKETDELGIDISKYNDDNKPNVLKKAQKEAYELIDTVNALKDTINTLSPVLMEGKKIMNIFENLKL